MVIDNDDIRGAAKLLGAPMPEEDVEWAATAFAAHLALVEPLLARDASLPAPPFDPRWDHD